MKIDEVCEIFRRGEPYFQCPVCASSFTVTAGKSLICENGHCYDFSSKGYVNFRPNHKQTSEIYSKKLFESRAAVFESGAYDKVADAIYDIILSRFGENGYIISHAGDKDTALNFLDAGCGEGYYAAKLSGLHGVSVFAADILKDAVLAACKRKARVKWMVADLTGLPLKGGSMDVVLNVLASANYDEFQRILSDRGILIKVFPGGEYLKEIRELAAPRLSDKEYSNEDVLKHFEDRLEIVEKRTIHYKADVDGTLLRQFIEMTPMMFGTNPGACELRGVSGVTIHFDILTGMLKSAGD